MTSHPHSAPKSTGARDEVFEPFGRWSGEVPAGFVVNFLGVLTRTAFFEAGGKTPRRHVQTTWPPIDEEYIAWVDLLTTVLDAGAGVTVAEIGAGWGRWLANTAAAARARGLSFHLVGAEPEPTHFRWMATHLADNQVPDSATTLHEAAVWTREGWVRFHIGDPRRWYGQAVAESPQDQGPPGSLDRLRKRLRQGPGRHLRTIAVVPAVTLAALLRGVETIDFLHADVQGAEAVVFRASIDVLAKLRKVHIRTHGGEVERELRDLFGGLGWESLHDYPALQTSVTPWGEIAFQDGVQTWVNPVAASAATPPSGPRPSGT